MVCYLCDRYSYPYLMLLDGGAVLLCADHRIAHPEQLYVRCGLPFGHEASWKRGTWA